MSLQLTALRVQHQVTLPQDLEAHGIEHFTIDVLGYALHDDDFEDKRIGTLRAVYLPAECLRNMQPHHLVEAVPELSLLDNCLLDNPHMTLEQLADRNHGLLYILGIHIEPQYQGQKAGTSLFTLALQRLQRTMSPEQFGIVLLAVPMDRSPEAQVDDIDIDPDGHCDPRPQHNPDPDQPEIRWGDWYRIADFDAELAQVRQDSLIRWYTRMGLRALLPVHPNVLYQW